MKFLVDHQLPAALSRFLQSEGHEAEHVREVGLKEAPDADIWSFAISRQMVVISKDEDFVFLATADNKNGQFVWVRLGNCRNQELIETFTRQLPHIIAALESGGNIIELR